MRFLSTRVNGILDYVVGVLLIISPWVLRFAQNGAETWVPFVIGVLLIVQALFTRYEPGLMRGIPVAVHLWIDGVLGAFLAVSPWLLNYFHRVWVPHLVLGLIVLLAALTTQTQPRLLPRRRADEAATTTL